MARLSLQWALAVQSFKSAALKRFAEKQDARKLPAQHVRRIRQILRILNGPEPLTALHKRKNWRLHPLTGDRKGVWSVHVSKRLRITFCYDGRDVYDLDLTQHYGD